MTADANISMVIKLEAEIETFIAVAHLDGQHGSIQRWQQKKGCKSFENWDGKNPEVVKYLCTWGKAESVAIEKDTTSEFADRGGNEHFLALY